MIIFKSDTIFWKGWTTVNVHSQISWEIYAFIDSLSDPIFPFMENYFIFILSFF